MTIEERVRAATTLERVRSEHRTGEPRPLADAPYQRALETRVHDYLRKTIALEEIWRTRMTAEMLDREIARMQRDSAVPDRLRQLFGALDHDPVLIRECLARPVLVERLVRNFFAFDDRIHLPTRRAAEGLRGALLARQLDPRRDHPWRTVVDAGHEWDAGRIDPLDDAGGRVGSMVEDSTSFAFEVRLERGEGSPKVARYSVPKVTLDAWWQDRARDFDIGRFAMPTGDVPVIDGLPLPKWEQTPDCPSGDSWHNGILDDTPIPRVGHTAVWTGSEMIVWGGSRSSILIGDGGRYDPATDTWSSMSGDDAPSARTGHSAVWSGNEMIIWGGQAGQYLADGRRYDPLTDTWRSISTQGAPTPRRDHHAIWTGSEMIVWGGFGGGTALGSGGRYDPVTDVWTNVPGNGAPSPRHSDVAVWAGSELVVWGGVDAQGRTDTGARYSPATNAWSPTSSMGAPSKRERHSAVWDGENVIVFGGNGVDALSSGGRYSPATDTWSPISSATTPIAGHDAAWTGIAMVVWGQSGQGAGAVYDSGSDSWTPMAAPNAPSFRYDPTVVWTGTYLVVWGGLIPGGPTSSYTDSGARYDPLTDAWTPVAGMDHGREAHTAVWTGNEMIVWGGGTGGGWFLEPLGTGAMFDPSTASWTPTSTVAAPGARYDHSAVWTGREMIVWGGLDGGLGGVNLNTGGRFDPALDRWIPTPTAGAPAGRSAHAAVWTGDEMVVWGGRGADGDVNLGHRTGGRYHPASETWMPTTEAGVPPSRSFPRAVWTGNEMIVWGGFELSNGVLLGAGGRYDPLADAWLEMTSDGEPSPRYLHAAAWTGDAMIVWGGWDGAWLDTGAGYNPAMDVWTELPLGGAPSPLSTPTAVWTGRELIVWGHGPDRARYEAATSTWNPVTRDNAPWAGAAIGHTAVWTGQMMIVWGGIGLGGHPIHGGQYFISGDADEDGDNLSVCDGDCNDGLATAYPGAAEVCDGLDNDCDGAVDELDADGDGYALCRDCDDADALAGLRPGEVSGLVFTGPQVLAWQVETPPDGAPVAYDVLRGNLGEFPVGSGAAETCLASGISSGTLIDGDPPPPSGLWYLVRTRARCIGSYGTTSGNIERSTGACSVR